MNGILAWLSAQAHIAGSVISAVASGRPAPARQVAVYSLAIVLLAVYVIPRLVKLASK